MTDISMWRLLAIVEVDQEDRIQCQCEGCGRIVYKAIHIVGETGGTIECWGSDCYERVAGRRSKKSDIKPEFGSTQGRRLTDQERELLKTNLALLIEKFREEAREEQERQRLLAEAGLHKRLKKEKMNWRRSEQASANVKSLSWEKGKCKFCGQITDDWWDYDGKTGLCKCRSCQRQGRS